MIPTQRFQGAVLPPILSALIAFGLIEPIGHRKDGSPIWPIEGGDGTGTSTIDRSIESLRSRRSALEDASEALVNLAESQRRDLTQSEYDLIQSRGAELKGIDAQLTELERLQQRSGAAAGERSRHDRAIGPRVQMVRGEDTYRKDDPDTSFIRDIYSAQRGDFGAAERLHRNNMAAEERERRDGTSGATSMGSFSPPRWVVDEYAELARAARTTANLVRQAGEPDALTITLPRITTGTSVASQSAENAAVSETDMVTAQLTRSTVTIAGQQDVSIQSLELGSRGTDRIIMADLFAAYNAELDRQVVRGAGTGGELLGINQVSSIIAVTYTDASPTLAEMYPKVADAIQQIHSLRLLAASAVIMHPRRWGWITAALDTAGRPMVGPSGAVNPIAVYKQATAEGQVGEAWGKPIYADANIATNLGAGTNEDQILVIRGEDILLYESAMRTRMLQDVLSANLTIRFQLFAYANLVAGRQPKAIATVGGTGCATPSF